MASSKNLLSCLCCNKMAFYYVGGHINDIFCQSCGDRLLLNKLQIDVLSEVIKGFYKKPFFTIPLDYYKMIKDGAI